VKILLCRTDRIGDLILSTPAIASVRASFPDARITIVTSPYNRVVMERNSDVDELIELPREVDPAAFGARLHGFDLAIALAPRAADIRLVGATRARVRVGYTYLRRWLARFTARLYLNRVMVSNADPELCERNPSCVVPHEVDQLFELVALAGAKRRVAQLRLEVRPEDEAAFDDVPADPIVLHLAPRWFNTGSTAESTLELAQDLRKVGPLVLTCAHECDAYGLAFERAGCRVVRGLTFHSWAALFAKARCVITVDTGATHVASAMRRPTVVAFEHRYFRLNSQEWAPYGVPNVLVRKPQAEDDVSLRRLREEIVQGAKVLLDA
jgi:ADP-heptose:LPS heptosyltransferase